MDLTLNKTAGRYIVTCTLSDSESALLQFDQLKRHKDGRITCRVNATGQRAGKEANLYQGSLNLMAGRSRSQLAKMLQERMPKNELDFERFVEEACRLVVEAEEDTAVAERLRLDEADTTEPEYLVYPCIPKRLPTIFFGPGGGGKTFFTMYFALLVQNGLSFMGRSIDKTDVLYCDWECDRREAARRFGFLARQMQEETGQEIILPIYRKSLLPLADDASEVAIEMEKNKIGMIIIDSAAMATGGDIIAAEAAIAFFNAIRKVCDPTEATALIITHVTKASRENGEKKRLPIGSIFFENLARIAWELRSHDVGDDALAVSFLSRKTNFEKKNTKFGLKMNFNGNKAKIVTISAEDVENEAATLEMMALDMLSKGPMRIKELAEDLGTTEGTIRNMLSRAKRKGKVTTPDRGLWGLAAHESEPEERYWDK